MKTSTSKWNDPVWRSKYGKQWREQRKKLVLQNVPATSSTAPNGEKTISVWKQKQLDRQAKQDALKPHPLGLETCPFCKASFFRKVEDKYEPILMDHCDPCQVRFYYYKGVKQ